MAKRSLQIKPKYLKKAENAFITLGLTQKALAIRLNLSRSTVSNFLRGKAIYKENFVIICETLKLDWQEITGLIENELNISQSIQQSRMNNDNPTEEKIESRRIGIARGNYNRTIEGNYYETHHHHILSDRDGRANNVHFTNKQKVPIDIEVLIKQLREKVKIDIETRCGTMLILDMSKPIELGKIYTQVNILEKISSRRRKDISELFKNCSVEDLVNHLSVVQRQKWKLKE